MDEFRATTGLLKELRDRAKQTGFVSLSAGDVRALVVAAQADLQYADPAKVRTLSRTTSSRTDEGQSMSSNPPVDSSKAPNHFGNLGRPPRTKNTRDLEERYQRSRERAPSDENPTSKPTEAHK
jgi:hypothetical protein